MNAEQWNGFQDRIARWEGAIMPPHENTPGRKLHRGMEEVDELQKAVAADDGTPQRRQEISEEAADVVIRMIGIVVATGGNMAELIDRKIQTIEQKYPAEQIGQEMKAGVPYDVSMARHKEAWQRRQRPAVTTPLPRGRAQQQIR